MLPLHQVHGDCMLLPSTSILLHLMLGVTALLLCTMHASDVLSYMTCRICCRPEFPPNGFSTPPAASRALHGLSQRASLQKVSATKKVFVSPLRQSSPKQVAVAHLMCSDV